MHKINSILSAQNSPLVQCTCADGSSILYCIGHTLHCKQLLELLVYNGNVLALLECRYWTIDRNEKEQISPLALLEAQWLVLAPAQQAS